MLTIVLLRVFDCFMDAGFVINIKKDVKLIHIFYVIREVNVQFFYFIRILIFFEKMSALRSENS